MFSVSDKCTKLLRAANFVNQENKIVTRYQELTRELWLIEMLIRMWQHVCSLFHSEVFLDRLPDVVNRVWRGLQTVYVVEYCLHCFVGYPICYGEKGKWINYCL